jgi:putative redox protein
MRNVRVRWHPEADRFIAEGGHREQRIAVNAPHDGAPTGFSAAELLLAGIGACSAWDVLDVLRKGRQRVHGVDVSVTGEQAEQPPWPYTRIDVEFTIRGERLRPSAVERAVDLSFDRLCSAIATVRGVATVTPRFTIVEEPSPTTPPAA